jgi:hypothetical protein
VAQFFVVIIIFVVNRISIVFILCSVVCYFVDVCYLCGVAYCSITATG